MPDDDKRVLHPPPAETSPFLIGPEIIGGLPAHERLWGVVEKALTGPAAYYWRLVGLIVLGYALWWLTRL
jgi:hypothetical protein